MDCIFCKIFSELIKSKKIIYENDNFFSIPDINPLVERHCLVISKKHFETILDLPDSSGSELLECIKKTALKMIVETQSKGFNLHLNSYKVAGQLVEHFHIHLLPRKEGDGFKPCA
ncbi:MAG: HIT family protein [archaeon]